MKNHTGKVSKPEPPSRMISLRLKTHIDKQVRAIASQKGINPSALIQTAISEYLERQTKK
jgi:predicted transcriptional regulator